MLYKLFLYLKYRNITKELNQQIEDNSIGLKLMGIQLQKIQQTTRSHKAKTK